MQHSTRTCFQGVGVECNNHTPAEKVAAAEEAHWLSRKMLSWTVLSTEMLVTAVSCASSKTLALQQGKQSTHFQQISGGSQDRTSSASTMEAMCGPKIGQYHHMRVKQKRYAC